MKTKIMRCLAFAVMVIALSACLVGCNLNSGDTSNGGNSTGGNSTGSATIEVISVKGNIKTDYCLNESLDVNGVKLGLIYSDDTEKEISLYSSMISGFNTQTAGSKTMTITYKSKTCTVNYTVDNAFRVGDYKFKMGSYYYASDTVYNSDGSIKETSHYTKDKTTVIFTFKNDNTGVSMGYEYTNGIRNEENRVDFEWNLINGLIMVSGNGYSYDFHVYGNKITIEQTAI